MTRLSARMSRLKVPSFQLGHFLGSLSIGSVYGSIVKYAIPSDANMQLFILLNKLMWPMGCAIGAYLVNTESHRKCKFRSALIGSYLPFLLSDSIALSSLLATLFINWNIEWKNPTEGKKRGFKKRIFILIVCASVYTSLSLTYVFNNSSLTINGEEIRLRDAAKRFFQSKEWENLKEFFIRLLNIYLTHGFDRLKNEFMNLFDAQGIAQAYEVLLKCTTCLI